MSDNSGFQEKGLRVLEEEFTRTVVPECFRFSAGPLILSIFDKGIGIADEIDPPGKSTFNIHVEPGALGKKGMEDGVTYHIYFREKNGETEVKRIVSVGRLKKSNRVSWIEDSREITLPPVDKVTTRFWSRVAYSNAEDETDNHLPKLAEPAGAATIISPPEISVVPKINEARVQVLEEGETTQFGKDLGSLLWLFEIETAANANLEGANSEGLRVHEYDARKPMPPEGSQDVYRHPTLAETGLFDRLTGSLGFIDSSLVQVFGSPTGEIKVIG